jgi:hypothetical protein
VTRKTRDTRITLHWEDREWRVQTTDEKLAERIREDGRFTEEDSAMLWGERQARFTIPALTWDPLKGLKRKPTEKRLKALADMRAKKSQRRTGV